MNAVEVFAPAKLNLTLRVAARRDDGYHEIESLIVPLAFGDTLRLTSRDDERLECFCTDATIPTDAGNLAVRAALELRRRFVVTRGVTIEIDKRIPAGAGLGGGSSDAAATLRGLRTLWGIQCATGELAEIGAVVGSDVPALVYQRPCIARGRGERVSLDVPAFRSDVLLLLPPLHASTAAVYTAFDVLPASHARAAPLERVLRELVEAAKTESEPGGDAFDRLDLALFNDLTAPAYRSYPQLAALADALETAVGRPFAMSGSGAAHFRLYPPTPAGEARRRRDGDAVAAAAPAVRVEHTRTLPL